MKEIIIEQYKKWLNSEKLTSEEKIELKNISNNEEEIENRFYTDLSFGTAGMRGIRGVGRNRMNRYNIRKATQGLANYIIEFSGEEGKKKGVAIAYDCRIDSKDNAIATAEVLAGNGIKTHLFDGIRSTPELSFAVRELSAISGIVITASHNPKEYNGYKVYWEDGAQIVEPQASGIINNVNKVDVFEDVKLMEIEEALKKGLVEYIDRAVDDKFIEAVKSNAINTNIPNKEEFKLTYTPLHGVGRIPAERVLKEMNFLNVFTVKEQAMPDGTFPTCAYANPEDTSVFELSTKLAEEVGAKICLANDPDADRVGIAIKDNDNNWFFPSGNQVGILIMDYILRFKKNIPKNAKFISTIVSSQMLETIAKANNVEVIRTLTGFKYIGEKIRQFEKGELDGTFMFGFEEAIGYLIGTHVRDKDGIVALMIIAEMAAFYDSIGSSLFKELINIYEKYGWYMDETIAITKLGGKKGLDEIIETMSKMRNKKHDFICGQKVEEILDFSKGVKGLPLSDVLQVRLEDKTCINIRPSGTEPKIKYYISIVDASEKLAKEKLEKTTKEFQEYVDSL